MEHCQFLAENQKLELDQGLFSTIFRIHKKLLEENSIQHFQSPIRGTALQVIETISIPNRENSKEILAVLRWNHLKPVNSHWEVQIADIGHQDCPTKIVDFLEEFQKLTRGGSSDAA